MTPGLRATFRFRCLEALGHRAALPFLAARSPDGGRSNETEGSRWKPEQRDDLVAFAHSTGLRLARMTPGLRATFHRECLEALGRLAWLYG